MRHLDLFSGIGGFSVGMEATQRIETVAFCEIDVFCKKILNKHWPTVPVYDDIKELTYDKLKADGIISKDKKIDILTGGYPCQPFSQAGAKKGDKDPRHLWPEMFRIIKEIRPDWIVAENVSGHIKLGLDTVLQDLADQNYSARTFSLSASSVGANHKRERVWIVANANGGGDQREKSRGIGKENEEETGNRKNDSSPGIAEGTDNAVAEQGSIAKMEHVEDTRQHSGRIEPSGNKESAERGTPETSERSVNTNTIAGSGKRATTLANAESVRSRKQTEQEGRQSFERTSETVANTDSNREKRNQSQDGKRSGLEQDSSDVADTESISSYGGENGNNQQETGNKKVKGKAGGVSGIVADGDQQIIQATTTSGNDEEGGKKSPDEHDRGRSPASRGKVMERNWDVEPELGRVANGVPDRTHRLKALGNAVVPQIPYYIAKAILEVTDA